MWEKLKCFIRCNYSSILLLLFSFLVGLVCCYYIDYNNVPITETFIEEDGCFSCDFKGPIYLEIIKNMAMFMRFNEQLFIHPKDIEIFHSSEYVFFIEIFLFFFIITLIFIGLLFKDFWRSFGISNFFIYLSIIILILLLILLFKYDLSSNIYTFGKGFVLNPWSINTKVIIVILHLVFFLVSLNYFKYESTKAFEFSIIILISMLGMFLLVSSNDFMILFFSVEIQSFCFYILASLKRYSNKSIEASIKYFILGAFSSCISLFGISLIYVLFSSTNFNTISNLIISSSDIIYLNPNFLLSILCITVGILFKLGIVPFHFWLPDVYGGSPVIATAYFSIVTKFSFFILLLKLFFFIFKGFVIVNNILLVLGIVTVMYGTIMGLYEGQLMRLIAYSSIAHTGYLLIAISLNSVWGFFAFFVYFFVYTVTNINIFTIILSYISYPDFHELKTLVDFANLFRSNKLMSISFSISLLSTGGLPFLAGFFGKFYIIKALLASGHWYLALILIMLSVISCVYYIRLIRLMFFNDKNKTPILFDAKISKINTFIIISTLFIIVFFFFLPGSFYIYILYFIIDMILSSIYGK
jgi:NADH-quinone oxidoreductase subunit N